LMHDDPTIEGVFVMDTPLNSPQIRLSEYT